MQPMPVVEVVEAGGDLVVDETRQGAVVLKTAADQVAIGSASMARSRRKLASTSSTMRIWPLEDDIYSSSIVRAKVIISSNW